MGVADCHKVNSKSLMPFGMGLFYFANSLIPAGIGPVKQPTCRESYQGGFILHATACACCPCTSLEDSEVPTQPCT